MWIGANTDETENSSQIAIAVFRDTQTNQWFVEKVEFNLGATRTRVNFQVPQPLAQAFTPEFMEELRPHLPTSHDRGLLADGTAQIDIAHLCLVGIRVAAQAMFNGIQKVWIRFQRAFGSVQAMLLPRHRTEQAAENALHFVAATALLDLLLPCLDILRLDLASAASPGEPSERVAARLAALQEKKHDLEFYVGLLTRYLAHSPAREASNPAELPSDAPSAPRGFRLPGPVSVRS